MSEQKEPTRIPDVLIEEYDEGHLNGSKGKKNILYVILFALIGAVVLMGIAWKVGQHLRDRETKNVESTRVIEEEKNKPLYETSRVLPGGNYDIFHRVRFGKTLVTCYAVLNAKNNKTLFHTCTFTEVGELL